MKNEYILNLNDLGYQEINDNLTFELFLKRLDIIRLENIIQNKYIIIQGPLADKLTFKKGILKREYGKYSRQERIIVEKLVSFNDNLKLIKNIIKEIR